MDQRIALPALAGLVVAAAAWLVLTAGARDRDRMRRALGIAATGGRAARQVSPGVILAALGRAVPRDAFDALGGGITSSARSERDGRMSRGTGLLLALGLFALATVNALWLLGLFAVPRVARMLVERAARRAESQHRRELERDVAAALDIFVLALDAGLPFERAITAYIETVDSVLAAELAIAARELEVGYRRREALERLATRTRSASLAAVSSSVRLAEDFGTPLASALRSLASDTRARRRQRLQEAALRAPVTMLLPTAAFILLPIFAIVLGPIAIRVVGGTLF